MSGDGRYEYVGKVVGECGLYGLTEFVVEHVGFGYGEDALFVDELWVEPAEFFEEYVVLCGYVVGVGGYHEE